MRNSETRCAELLKSFLEANGREVSYRDGPDPPDIVIHIGGEVWGVEHTSLHQYVSGLSVDLHKNEMARPGVLSQAIRMENRLRRNTDGKRWASWSLVLLGPIGQKDLKLIEETALKAILDDDPTYFDGFPENMVTVKRIESADTTLYVGSGLRYSSTIPGSDSLTSQPQAVVDYCVKRAMQKKQPDPQVASAYDKYVLLLDKYYWFADSERVAKALQSAPGLVCAFDHVFLVDDGNVARVGGGTSW